MMQGDAYYFRFRITGTNENGEAVVVDPSIAEDVEIIIGHVRRAYPGNLSYDNDSQMWIFPMSQLDSMQLRQTVPAQVRIKFTDGSVIGKPLTDFVIENSSSKVVL